jgi:ribosome-binding factor A
MPRSFRHGPAKGPSQRQLKVGEQIRHVLADILAHGDIRDPVLAGVIITVTEVAASPDLKHATAYCTPLGGKNAPAIIEALNRHKAFLRGELGRGLDLRYTPSVHFEYDSSFDRGAAMDALLRQPAVKTDLKKDEDEPDGA